MACGKTVRFPIGNGEWKSGKHYSPNKKKKEEEDDHEHEHEHPETEKKTQNNSVWSKPEYDTEKYESYIHYLMGVEKEPNSDLFNNEITVSWGSLQEGFASESHEYSAEVLSGIIDSDIATDRFNVLKKMTLEEVEISYKKAINRALSDRDDIEERVTNAFLKEEGLEKITIDGKFVNALVFDENSEQSKRLIKSSTFNEYYDKYILKVVEIISETNGGDKLDINALSNRLKDELGKPDFSTLGDLVYHDYFGLMGGVQKADIDFEIVPISEKEYELKTKMYFTDWYGADADDVNKNIDFKELTSNSVRVVWDISTFPFGVKDAHSNINNLSSSVKNTMHNIKAIIPGLQELFWLQHHYGYKPFATQIIYKSNDKLIVEE